MVGPTGSRRSSDDGRNRRCVGGRPQFRSEIAKELRNHLAGGHGARSFFLDVTRVYVRAPFRRRRPRHGSIRKRSDTRSGLGIDRECSTSRRMLGRSPTALRDLLAAKLATGDGLAGDSYDQDAGLRWPRWNMRWAMLPAIQCFFGWRWSWLPAGPPSLTVRPSTDSPSTEWPHAPTSPTSVSHRPPSASCSPVFRRGSTLRQPAGMGTPVQPGRDVLEAVGAVGAPGEVSEAVTRSGLVRCCDRCRADAAERSCP